MSNSNSVHLNGKHFYNVFAPLSFMNVRIVPSHVSLDEQGRLFHLNSLFAFVCNSDNESTDMALDLDDGASDYLDEFEVLASNYCCFK